MSFPSPKTQGACLIFYDPFSNLESYGYSDFIVLNEPLKVVKMDLNAFDLVLRVVDVIVKRVWVHVDGSGCELMEFWDCVQSGKGGRALEIGLIVGVGDSHPNIRISKSDSSSSKIIRIRINIGRRLINRDFPNPRNQLLLRTKQIHYRPPIRNILLTRSVLSNRYSPIIPIIPKPKRGIPLCRHLPRQMLVLDLRPFRLGRLSKGC